MGVGLLGGVGINYHDLHLRDEHPQRHPCRLGGHALSRGFFLNTINRANPRNRSEAGHGWDVAKHIGMPAVKSFEYAHGK
jgi:hypothetical protein